MLPARDSELVQIVDRDLADATLRSRRSDGTSWLACQPGCTSCCHGVFRISMLDAERLRAGLAHLAALDPARASALRARAVRLAEQFASIFPGDPRTGRLLPADDPAWDTFADLPITDAACPVLDPDTGRCELYLARPLTCRIFGPPVWNDEGLGLCELCYVGAGEAEMLAGEMHLHHGPLEEQLNAELPAAETIIVWAVLPA